VLYQKQNGQMRVMGYGSRSLSQAENKYHSGKLEFLVLHEVGSLRTFRDHLYYAPHFTVYTDNNPLTYVLTTARLGCRVSGLHVQHKIQTRTVKRRCGCTLAKNVLRI
jgi:hypothetical protein